MPTAAAETSAAVPPPTMFRERTFGREAYAGLVTRLLALCVDAALLAVAVPAVAVGAPDVWGSITGTTPRWLQVGAGVAAAALPFVYFSLCWWASGRTAGGALLGAAARRVDGSRLGVIHAGVRAVLGLLFAPVWLAGMVLIAFDPRRRALHDVFFHTVVRRVGS
ncbi:RDD family protein [Actinospica sp. MGRD01-02]|uniref:RDD family protein n=1 Tax=Actinospica acidithermotolerans TaxID=2828514 RepID=A0A941EGI1_9ACTN|nr:RDD family protein [Actinospica acidithermotolerans]MBR7830871.1 RDD family protein [Actinospica acidithermotolerans]